ncbi:MAG: DUF4261 domain-containing protein [Bacteroidales bacterium]|jgi:hypothetical protein|nr:DUF4261 domain-containing protein [Bacteroidales bacterium]
MKTTYEPLKRRMPYRMALLFDRKGELPNKEVFYEKLRARGYEVEPDIATAKMWSFYLPEYTVDCDGAKCEPYQLLLTDYTEVKKSYGDELSRGQFKRPDDGEMLDSCKWQVFIGDFFSSAHPANMRAQILSDWLEIALELFPTCKCVWFEGSQNVMSAADLRNNPYEGDLRIFHGAVKVRFFRILDTEDMVVDTLGLYVFGIPDVQFHFRGLNPDHVVGLAANVGIYQFCNNVPIENDETVDGLDADGSYRQDIRWKCQYEVSLFAPQREVLDVNTGKFAAGIRDE